VPEVRDLPGAVAAPRFRGAVRFENLTFAYDHGLWSLQGINVNIEPGACVALVGPSGSGKSTLVSLLLRLYDPVQGCVLIDGRDIREFTLFSLRSQISAVLQDNLLFAASVRDNIAHGAPAATPEQVESAARLANAHEFIIALPESYDTVLGERGVTLSQGQRQRIAIARAAVRRAPILILDEPMTGLDKKNEQIVLDSIKQLDYGCTTFLITHDLTHAAQANLILYLESGRVLERGTHPELLRSNGRYAALYAIQAGSRDKTDQTLSPALSA
jgi:ATP-binding cassette subfamily B protein